MNKKTQYIEALCKELELRKDYLQGEEIQTIYFGGGTPSQLSKEDFEKIFTCLPLIDSVDFRFASIPLKGTWQQHQTLCTNQVPFRGFRGGAEITLEANPDDITPEYLNSLTSLNSLNSIHFNRISLGVQSFNDSELQFLHRRHNAQKAIQAVRLCQNFGFQNISIDLMYGLPNQTMQTWKETLHQAIDLRIQHISAYHLIYEEGTKLHELLKKGKIAPIEETLSVEMFSQMIDILEAEGFEHYEISNFAQSGFASKHNSSYWNGTHYLGIGASAHSFNGKTRQWNVADIDEYINHINRGELPVETETIGETEAYNDFILTRMRTMKGINLNELETLFGREKKMYCLLQAQKHIDNQTVQIQDNYLRLMRKGIFISDGIMSDLFV